MPRNNNMLFNLLALVDKSQWNFLSVGGRPGAFLMDNPHAFGRPFARHSHSCLLGLNDPHGRIGVGSIFSSPSNVILVSIYLKTKQFFFFFCN